MKQQLYYQLFMFLVLFTERLCTEYREASEPPLGALQVLRLGHAVYVLRDAIS